MQEGEQGEASVEIHFLGFPQRKYLPTIVYVTLTYRLDSLQTKLNASVIEVRKFRLTFFTKKEH